jgi:ABC-type multidrug transport system ATPase subunit
MGLWKKRDELVNHLSEGQGQRVSIARALMPNPPLILLDEPHSGLDISASRYLDRLLRELLEQNHALILTTHDAAHGLDLAQEMAILKKGEIIYQSDTHQTNRQELVEIYSQIFEPGGLKI